VRDGNAAPLFLEATDYPGVRRAAGDLQADIERVAGIKPALVTNRPPTETAILVGTLGKSALIASLVKAGKLKADAIAGQWESFVIATVADPLPGVGQALVIAGSDKRGTIYGIYEISAQIGVSPWHWWADVPPRRHAQLFVRAGTYVEGPPSVKYRGLFINDEAPDLSSWVRDHYGALPGGDRPANYGRGFYTNLFEVMLRLRANYLWPAMWNNAFNEDDPANPRLADEYGIVMGTSHQEPMLRSQQEWDRHPGQQYGNWNYNQTNQRPVLEQFWRDGIRRNKNYESLITLGLRAENDSGRPTGGDLTGQIIGVQRQILAEELNPDPAQIPQVWCLYKEVMDFYNAGLRAPEDVTLLWAEDNWGNVRRLPDAEERRRRGGAGVYYHFDYHGLPRNYQWINTDPLPKIWDQMTLARQYGADRIWIVNAGHFKGYELPLEFFMALAWNTPRWTNEHLDEFTQRWVERQFGPEHAAEIAGLVTACTQFNGRRKPELLEARTYSVVNYHEFEQVTAAYAALAARAETINGTLPAASRDAFYELVGFPAKAGAGLNALYLAAARNALYARQGRASANDYAAQTRAWFQAQTNLTAFFNHTLAGGKWNHFMDQTYIGYRHWDGPPQNNLDAVSLAEIQVPDAPAMGVAVEGAESAATNGEMELPPFDVFNQQRREVEVFNRGKTGFAFAATATVPWIVLSATGGRVEKDLRLSVSVDWSRVPTGANTGEIHLAGAGGAVSVKVEAGNPAEPARETLRGFVEGDGCVSLEAEHFSRNLDAGASRWIRIPHYGHTLSAMRADGPTDVLATPGKDSPRLEYDLYLFHPGTVEVQSTVGPTLNFLPGRPLRYAVSFDAETPEVVEIVPANFNANSGSAEWSESVKFNGRRVKSTHTIAAPGWHTLKIWMVDPAVAVEKIVVNTGGVRPSYLGPPESYHH
jgi:hypothetical protein